MEQTYSAENPPKDELALPNIIWRLMTEINIMLVQLRKATERGKPDEVLYQQYLERKKEIRFLRSYEAAKRKEREDKRFLDLIATFEDWKREKYELTKRIAASEVEAIQGIVRTATSRLQALESDVELQRLAEWTMGLVKTGIKRIKGKLSVRAWLKGAGFHYVLDVLNPVAIAAEQELSRIRRMANTKRHEVLARK